VSCQEKEKYGALIPVMKIPIEGKVESLSFIENAAFHEGLAVVQSLSHEGYINKEGKFQIKPIFDFAGRFSEGLARVAINDKFGYINKEGTFIIKPQFNWASDFSDGLARIDVGETESHRFGFINKAGQIVIEPNYSDAQDFSEELAPVSSEGKWGYINKTGKLTIGLNFEYASKFFEGIAVVKIEGLYGCIDTEGRYVISPKFTESISDFHEGMAQIRIGGYHESKVNRIGTLTSIKEKWVPPEIGFINRSGEIIIPIGQFAEASDFHDGLALAKPKETIDRGYRFIDKTGKVLIASWRAFRWPFSEGLAAASWPDKGIGFIDKSGSFVIKPEFDAVIPFSEGASIVKEKGSWFVLKRLDTNNIN